MSEPVISVKDLHKSYGSNEILRGVTFDVAPKEVVCVIGPSGSGKSTLCRTINRLETITSGTISIDGKALPAEGKGLATLRADVGMVFQSFVRGFCCDDLEEFAICDQRMHSRWTGFTKKLWTELFRRAPKLRAFYCTADPGYDEGFARPVLAALATSEAGRMLCPALEDVFVSGDKTWSSLQCFIVAEMRAQAGHPLKRVSMRLPHYASFSDPEETDLPMLRKHVEKVDLDPPEMTFPEYPEIS